MEKSKKSINVEGGFLFCGGWNFSKSVSLGPTFIREMRVDLRSFGKLHNSNDSNTHLLGGCVVINQKECHSWCSNHVQTANYFNTLTVEMLNLFYYPKFKSSVPKSLCYIKMYSQLNFRSVIYSYLFSMSAIVSIQVKINVFWILKVKVPFYKFIIIAFFLYGSTWNFQKTCCSKWSKK